MDFKDLEKLIPSLLPIILIIVVSWVFSFLASKMRKPQQQEGESAPAERGGDLLGDLFNLGKGQDVFQRPQGRPAGPAGEIQPMDMGDRRPYQDVRGPSISPRPIEPRWWGA
jgi:hypothetical protein